MGILKKEEFAAALHDYYVEHYGEQETDEWFEQPAVNVWVFRRGDTFVTLKSHILTGEVTEKTEKGE